MPVTVIALQHITGTQFSLNSNRKVECYKFSRNPRIGNYPRATFTIEEFNRISEDLFTAPNNPKMFVLVEPEIAAADAELIPKLAAAEKERDEAKGAMDALTQELERAKEALAEASQPALGDQEVSLLLGQRAELLELLRPFLQEGDTPIDTLKRITDLVAEAPPEETPNFEVTDTGSHIETPAEDTAKAHLVAPPKEYNALLDYAKTELGLFKTGSPPNKATLKKSVEDAIAALDPAPKTE